MSNKLHAGVPYTVPDDSPVNGKIYYACIGMDLYRVRLIGRDGYFDNLPRFKFVWLNGPNKGQTQSSYCQIFWRRPRKAERAEIWESLTSYEKQKLRDGKYPGLKLEMFIGGAA